MSKLDHGTREILLSLLHGVPLRRFFRHEGYSLEYTHRPGVSGKRAKEKLRFRGALHIPRGVKDTLYRMLEDDMVLRLTDILSLCQTSDWALALFRCRPFEHLDFTSRVFKDAFPHLHVAVYTALSERELHDERMFRAGLLRGMRMQGNPPPPESPERKTQPAPGRIRLNTEGFEGTVHARNETFSELSSEWRTIMSEAQRQQNEKYAGMSPEEVGRQEFIRRMRGNGDS
jgi:hypothetical protein